jgi:hypothetical protein
MHLIELLLLADKQFSEKRGLLADELSQRFGGTTAFTRAPAKGLFQQGTAGWVREANSKATRAAEDWLLPSCCAEGFPINGDSPRPSAATL